ncbi:uncharacterized protein K452DRAFT_353213 [Aplosporella prunicola CBS 121167]|uniref:Cytochrome b5 heme-binding domain-containing protein n=1 Tax=Aplosporella prunicola CBS 121167 TaxID=1176127 RepID=A0A6A6B2E7_9PEZI|nr:uncharacterized protein K452DRAFT_353213 [Aplosporella prunicola CBS 121167]KAF2138382.1 hypothetical protein K452DRAFT_353213 [Aplosporella prunicola CBS 121167]
MESVPETKELKAQWNTEKELQQFTASDVAAHKSRNDMWIVIHGKVFDVTKYLDDHPGGVDTIAEVAGGDATAAFEDVGHSEDATEIMQPFLIGTMKDAQAYVRPQAVRLVKKEPQAAPVVPESHAVRNTALGVVALGAAGSVVLSRTGAAVPLQDALSSLPSLSPTWLPKISLPKGGFANGFIVASAVSLAVGSIVAHKLNQMTEIEHGFTKYPPHIKSKRISVAPRPVAGFLAPKEYKKLKLVRKDTLAPNVYRFVFELPTPQTVLGLPIGQHVAIKAQVGETAVTRSYTPTSNNKDLGRLELVIRCYPDGLLTGKYLAHLNVGDEVEFRGPKGAMRYRKGWAKRIGMIAGGTGITPMYQVIRAICEDERDTTEIRLIYANRSEGDILLRKELETFARRYPKNFRMWYMLDQAPEGWEYGTGYVTAEVMREHLHPAGEDSKVMLCGPPGMVNAAKGALVGMGFQAPGAVAKITDQIFCF